MKVLVTGINGFAASHLARLLIVKGHEVHGTIRVRSDLHRIADLLSRATLHLIELTDSLSVNTVVSKVNPDRVFHLAAQSYVKSSWDAPLETYHTTVDGTVNILEACRRLPSCPRIFISSTSEIYGEHDGYVDEDTPATPNTHYGIAKLAQDCIGRLYAHSYHLPVVVGRSCNITGPGRADVFVDSNFAKQIAMIEKGMVEPVIKHGNLGTKRDFVDVRDVVRGYCEALELGSAGEVFCFGTGRPTAISEMLAMMVKQSTAKSIRDELDLERVRPLDTKIVCSKAEKARRVLGWEPTIDIETSFVDLLNYWRRRL